MIEANFWGRLITRLRDEQGVTQRQLCERARVNRTTLSRVEKGAWPVNVDFLEAVLGCLGYDLDAIPQDCKKGSEPAELSLTKVD